MGFMLYKSTLQKVSHPVKIKENEYHVIDWCHNLTDGIFKRVYLGTEAVIRRCDIK